MSRARYSDTSRRNNRHVGLAVVASLCTAGLLFAGNFMIPSLSSASAASEPEVGMEVGQRYPDLALPSLDGSGPLSVSHFRGRKIILFQFASW